MYFQNPGRQFKNLEEIQKIWKKLSKNLWPPCVQLSLSVVDIICLATAHSKIDSGLKTTKKHKT